MKIRNMLSVISGVVVGVIIIILGEGIMHAANPLPAGMDMTNPESFKTYVANAPVSLHFMELGIYALSCLVGGYVASSVALDNKINRAITLGGIFMGLGMFSLVSMNHPTWVIFTSVLAFLPFAWLGGVAAVKSRKKKE